MMDLQERDCTRLFVTMKIYTIQESGYTPPHPRYYPATASYWELAEKLLFRVIEARIATKLTAIAIPTRLHFLRKK